MLKTKNFIRVMVTVTVLAFVSIAAHAATIALKADLKASSEVPPKDSGAWAL